MGTSKPNKASRFWKILGSIFIGFVLFIFILEWMNSSFLAGEEYGTMGEILHVKHWFDGYFTYAEARHQKEVDSILKNYLLIDISKSNTLVYCDDDRTTNVTKVNRKKVAQLVNLLSRHKAKVKFMLCDIILDQPYDQEYDHTMARYVDSVRAICRMSKGLDSLVQTLEEKTSFDDSIRVALKSINDDHKLILPIEYSSKASSVDICSVPQKPCIFDSLSTGLAQYDMFFNSSFYRYSYIDHDLRQVPLCIYDNLQNDGVPSKMRSLCGIEYLKMYDSGMGGIWMNRITPFFRVTADDLKLYKNYYRLNDFLVDTGLINRQKDDLIVIIGNFENVDVHSTILQRMTGSLILLNLYESLQHKDNRFEWWFILLTLAVFSMVGYFTLTKAGTKEKSRERKRRGRPKRETIWQSILFVPLYALQSIWHFIVEEKNHFVLFGYTVISLLWFHHYLFFISSLLALFAIEYFIGLIKHFRHD